MFRKLTYLFIMSILGLIGLFFIAPSPSVWAGDSMVYKAVGTTTPMPATSTTTPREETLQVNQFTTSALTVEEGEFVWIQASGAVKVGPFVGFVGPEGRGAPFLAGYSIAPNIPHGALLCRIKGQMDYWDYCGKEIEARMKTAGQWEFQINDKDQSNNDPDTAFMVHVVVAPYSVRTQQTHQLAGNTSVPTAPPSTPTVEKIEAISTPTGKQAPTDLTKLDAVWHNNLFEFKYPAHSGLKLDQSNSSLNNFIGQSFANTHMVNFAATDFDLVFALSNSFDEVLNSSVQAIQLGIATNLLEFIKEEHLTLHDRWVMVFEMRRGNQYGIWNVVQLESGEGLFMIAWIDQTKVETWRTPIRAIVESIDTPKAATARKATANVYQPASTELRYSQPVTAVIGYDSQQWTLRGKAGDVVQVSLNHTNVVLQLQWRDPYSATVMFLPQRSPFQSPPFVLPYDGLYQIIVSAPPPLKTGYQLQINKLAVPEIPVGVETQVQLREDMPYIVFRGNAMQIATITAKDSLGNLPLTFYPATYEERKVDAYSEGTSVRLPYTGPYLLALATSRSGDGIYTVHVEQSPTKDIRTSRPQTRLQTEDDKRAMPLVKAELVPGVSHDEYGACLPGSLIECRFLFSGKAGEEIVITARRPGIGSNSPSIDLLMPTGGHFAALASEQIETQPELFKLGPIKLPVDGIYVVNLKYSSGILVEFK